MAIVAIVGAGMMGSGISWPLSDNGHEVRVVGTHLDDEIIRGIKFDRVHIRHQRAVGENVTAYYLSELDQAIQDAQVIVCGVSSPGVDWFVDTMTPYFKPQIPVLLITKGLMGSANGDLKIFPTYMNERLPEQLKDKINFSAVVGPCIAQELAAHRQTAVYFVGSDEKILEYLRGLFSTDYYHVYTSTNLLATETGVALKNAYAIAINIAIGWYQLSGQDGLAHMYNPQAALFAQALHEMWILTSKLNAPMDEFVNLTGSGDLYVTVFGGRNARLGQLLGQGYSYEESLKKLDNVTLEGVHILNVIGTSLPKLADRGIVDLLDFPLIMHLFAVINQNAEINIPWDRFYRQKRN
jgi:glycerol-3-phosphate dehydrogenase (NAD(P)+)